MTLILTLRKYTYSQWTDRNSTVHRATLKASRATHRLSLWFDLANNLSYSAY